ncbi:MULTISPECIES: glycosyltransferase family 4 protein [Aphanothece]|uniref:glycosyltransferase family 4 protein n=1 Tax=Aphanothece TaxID=1121 RepID=UPI00398F209E
MRQRFHWRQQRSRKARLTLVNQFFPPDYAATGQLLDDLTRRLASSGLQSQILTGMPNYAGGAREAASLEFEPNRCIRRTRVTRFWPRRIRGRAVNGLFFCLRIAARLMRYSWRGDLLCYTTEPPYLPIVGWLVHRLTATPYLLIIYDLYPEVLVELKVLPADHWLCRLWRHGNRLALAAAQEVVVLSQPMADRIAALAPAVRHKLQVIPSWADPETIRPLAKLANPFVREHGLEQAFTVLYSGNQGRCHDLVTLVAAAAILQAERDIVFLIQGDGPQNTRLRHLVADLNLANCRFLPWQDPAVLPLALAAADLAVVSVGIQGEGLVAPSKLYGHLAAGTPIAAITPATSYLRPLVENGGCGRWFANGDAVGLAAWIRALHADPPQVAAYGRAARELLLATASLEKVSAAYLSLILRHLPARKREVLRCEGFVSSAAVVDEFSAVTH